MQEERTYGRTWPAAPGRSSPAGGSRSRWTAAACPERWRSAPPAPRPLGRAPWPPGESTCRTSTATSSTRHQRREQLITSLKHECHVIKYRADVVAFCTRRHSVLSVIPSKCIQTRVQYPSPETKGNGKIRNKQTNNYTKINKAGVPWNTRKQQQKCRKSATENTKIHQIKKKKRSRKRKTKKQAKNLININKLQEIF